MIRSMTAFADGEMSADNLTILCELRSVNHRYSDVSVKLPERLRFAEADVRRLISEKLKRGKIECCLSYKKQAGEASFNVNREIVQRLLAATAAIEAEMHNPQPFSALDVLAFPGVQQEQETDKEALRDKIVQLLDDTLDKMLETRAREGAQLAQLLEDRCQKVMLLVEAAHKRMPEVLNNLRNKLTARVLEMVAEPNFDRLEQELVLLAQKLDVAEELDRLETHVLEVLRVLKQPEPTGRRLDFLMQEMNREANTLGSKSADREMTQISIDLKVLIEQMREQIQNIE
ncbi:YicC/YloC family endoribonuclease [Methylomonas koyamae]|uniref:YicC/YloC family endoribonuclease n=1 Tax=Methylomonas koyamae TaxID=702114 RepID=UPI002873F305|nr:YicC/YloC family endoribonuclease [Methylomonas koyamae]WNB76405.1 YicC/YloC family endoribonuclease [Methylomonas koyamae]